MNAPSSDDLAARLAGLSDAERADLLSKLPARTEPGFTLDPSAPLPAKLRNFYRHTYADYATGSNGAPDYRNSKDGRTVKRWVNRGRKAQPHCLPPLDSPALMADWFRKIFPKEPVPPALLDCEKTAPEPASSAPPAPGAAAVPPGAEPSRITSIDLDGLQMGEGEQVRQARTIAKANYNRVQEASLDGKSDDYRRWFPVWSDSLELLRKLEKEDREARKASGNLIDRGPVLGELAQLVEALRIMHEGMPSKIVSELEKSGVSRFRRVLRLIKPAIADAVRKVRESEAALFLNLESLNAPEGVREHKLPVAA